MIKECITYLLEHNYSVQGLNKSLKIINEMDEDQLEFSLVRGILLFEDIVLYKYQGSGFRCINHQEHIYGRKPICNIIEKKLNERLSNIINNIDNQTLHS